MLKQPHEVVLKRHLGRSVHAYTIRNTFRGQPNAVYASASDATEFVSKIHCCIGCFSIQCIPHVYKHCRDGVRGYTDVDR